MKKSVLCILWMAILITAACRGGGEAAEAPSEPAAVEAPKEEVFYTLTADVYPEEGGLVYPMEAEVPEGETIEVEAIPVPGYEFEGWSGASSLSSPNLSLTMDGDKQLTAHFKLKLTPTPEATLTPTPEPSPVFINPEDVSEDHIGETIKVCGVVTNFAATLGIDPPQNLCDPQGNSYSYIKLDTEFPVYSYDWGFKAGWLGAGLCLEDTVESFWGKPAFIFDKQEAEADGECFYVEESSMRDGVLRYDNIYHCPSGSYFQPCPHCENSHFNLPEFIYIPDDSDFGWDCME